MDRLFAFLSRRIRSQPTERQPRFEHNGLGDLLSPMPNAVFAPTIRLQEMVAGREGEVDDVNEGLENVEPPASGELDTGAILDNVEPASGELATGAVLEDVEPSAGGELTTGAVSEDVEPSASRRLSGDEVVGETRILITRDTTIEQMLALLAEASEQVFVPVYGSVEAIPDEVCIKDVSNGHVWSDYLNILVLDLDDQSPVRVAANRIQQVFKDLIDHLPNLIDEQHGGEEE